MNVAAWGITACCALTSSAAPVWGAEPVASRDHRAVSLAFLRFELSPPSLGLGGSELAIGLTVANDFRRAPGLDEDYEVARLAFRGRWGLQDRLDAWVELPVLTRDGGFLDTIIDAWHRAVLGWKDPVRDATPKGRSVVARTGRYRFGSAQGLGDVTVGLTWAVGPDTRWSVALKVPAGASDALLGSGGIDLGAAIDHRVALGRDWVLALQAALVAQGPAPRIGAARGLVDQQSVALAWAPNSRDVWSVLWQSERAPVTTGIAGADATHRLITFGYRRRLDSRNELELFCSEDRDLFNGRIPELANTGPDFSAGVRLVVRLGKR